MHRLCISSAGQADLDARDDGLRQNALQNLHGFAVLSQHPLHNGLDPGGVGLHPEVGLDASQQLCPLQWLAASFRTHRPGQPCVRVMYSAKGKH